MENFREMSGKFLAAGAAIQVKSSEELGAAWASLLREPERAARMGASRAGTWWSEIAARRSVFWSTSSNVIGSDRGESVKRSSGWLRLLWPLSLLYSLVARAKAWCYARGIFRTRKLPGTVISVGNLTVGGTGKTPMVLAIAERSPRKGSTRRF